MDIRTEIDPKAGIRRHKVTGEVAVSELTSALQELYSVSTGNEELFSLWDLTEADVDLEANEVRAISEFVAQHWGKTGRARAAIVVTEDLAFGLARMYESLLSARTPSLVKICRNVEEANRWLTEDAAG